MPLNAYKPGLAQKSALTMTEKVKQVLGPELAGTYPTACAIAKQLDTSVRTLSRALAREGVSCKQVVETHLMSLTLDYLNDEQYTLEDIAVLLGYESSRSYSQAFMRCYGEAPQSYRSGKGGKKEGCVQPVSDKSALISS